MCRWGCPTTDTSYQCRWCGTRFCLECKKGDYNGEMKTTKESSFCKKCKQANCIGPRVEYVPPKNQGKNGKGKSSSPAKKKK